MHPRALLLALSFSVVPAHAQWFLQTSNTTADLRGISNAGDGVAWASGTDGAVLRTTNSGATWQSCSMPPGAAHLDFRGIQAFDADTALVLSSGKGPQSRIYKTTDGCRSWKLLITNSDPDGFWDALRFSGPTFGVLTGDPVEGQLYARWTSDGGVTWRRFQDGDMLAVGHETAGMFAASNSSVLLTAHPPLVLAVANVGATPRFYEAVRRDACTGPSCSPDFQWLGPDQIPIPIPSNDSRGAFSLACRLGPDGNPAALVIVGGDYRDPANSRGTAAYADAAEQWHAATTPPRGYRSSVDYDPATRTWIAVGPTGTDVSTDDGRTWRALLPSPPPGKSAEADRNWNALSLPYVVGPRGRIGRLNPAALRH